MSRRGRLSKAMQNGTGEGGALDIRQNRPGLIAPGSMAPAPSFAIPTVPVRAIHRENPTYAFDLGPLAEIGLPYPGDRVEVVVAGEDRLVVVIARELKLGVGPTRGWFLFVDCLDASGAGPVQRDEATGARLNGDPWPVQPRDDEDAADDGSGEA